MLRRIPLGKMNNLRDLGGYPAGDGVTVWERFLRGDNPAGLSEQDIQWLRERDITTIVDLRSGEELARQPDQLRGQPGFLYHHCPLVGIEKLPNLEADIGRAYFEAMDRLTCVGRAMRILAAAPGGVLFHCTAGKDRTGIAAALLLSALGVGRETVLEDFVLTNRYLTEQISAAVDAVRARGADDEVIRLVRGLAGVDRSCMETLLDTLDERYGGVPGFLSAELGFSQEELARLRELYLE